MERPRASRSHPGRRRRAAPCTTCSARNQTCSSWRRRTSPISRSLEPQSLSSSVVVDRRTHLLDDGLVRLERAVDHDRDFLGAIRRARDRRQLSGVTGIAHRDAAQALDALGDQVDQLELLLGVLVEQQVELVEGRARDAASDASCTARTGSSCRRGSRSAASQLLARLSSASAIGSRRSVPND